MREFNNRDIAKAHAEYITGKELRRYLARKVKKYVGDNPIVFDGAVGSGQLEEFINPKEIFGIEIQELAGKAFLENYPGSKLLVDSFFNYGGDFKADCVIMNPPFSIKYKDLSDKEKENITNEFPWKKSGVVDDIFVLKSLNYTKRFGFYILFPGLTYRKSEKVFREILADKLAELNVIENAFEDTSISVIFLVIDKEKKDKGVFKEIYDCKLKKIKRNAYKEVDLEQIWRQPFEDKEDEAIDIDKVNKEVNDLTIKHFDNALGQEFLIASVFTGDFNTLRYLLGEFSKLISKYKLMMDDYIKSMQIRMLENIGGDYDTSND